MGKELKPSSAGGSKPGMAKGEKPLKPTMGGSSRPLGAKEMPAKGGTSRTLTLEEVAERLRVDPGHVEAWINEGVLRGTSSSVQVYELEKFRAGNHRLIHQAQRAPAPQEAPPDSKAQKSQGKKPRKASEDPKARAKEARGGASPLQWMADAFKNVFKGMIFAERKPAKSEPYVESRPYQEPLTPPPTAPRQPEDSDQPRVSNIQHTAMMVSPFAKGHASEELAAPPAPSSEVWPSLENFANQEAAVPDWLNKSVESSFGETLVLKADQIMAAASQSQVGAPSGSLREEKQRNQQLLEQLQEQRRLELELQDKLETLNQRLELSIASERDVRAQLKRARQELQETLEQLEQKPPAGGADPEALKQVEEERNTWLQEKNQLIQVKGQMEQRCSLLEQQIERLRSQAEEIRQHGLQWHQLATQQDQQLKTLKSRYQELEMQAEKALEDLEGRLAESEQDRLQAESLHQKQAMLITTLENEIDSLKQRSTKDDAHQQVRSRDLAIQELQDQLDRLQAHLSNQESQQRSQVQRWEQELQASASWVQKLTEAVSARDRKIQELQQQQTPATASKPSHTEEELKSQVMSLRVELTSLRRNYEIISLQAKNLEKQLQESQQGRSPAPSQAPLTSSKRPVLSLDLNPSPGTASFSATPETAQEETEEESGSFRKRLNARLRSLGPTPADDPPKKGLEPPPFLELDIPES